VRTVIEIYDMIDFAAQNAQKMRPVGFGVVVIIVMGSVFRALKL
jgi:hypothetical protein